MTMRRSVWIVLATALAMLGAAFVFQAASGGTETVRYHQHLSEPGEEALGQCLVCGGERALCTHLPIIALSTGGQKIPGKAITGPDGLLAGYETGANGEEEIRAQLSVIDQAGVWHHAEDAATLTASAMLRVRGNSSRFFSKSSYRLRLVEDKQPEIEARQPLLGMQQGSEWALYGPFLDKTLLRNYMWLNLSAEIMGYAPNVRFCEVLLDGEYQGLYLLMETIAEAAGEGRLALTKYQDGDPISSYLVRIENRINPEKFIPEFTYYTYRLEDNKKIELLYPGLGHQNEQVKGYVQTDLSEIEKTLYSLEMTGGSGAWREKVDMNSFVDYYILEEFLAINDTFSASTYFYRDVRGKLKAGPVWDFNNALDNFFESMPDDEFILSQRGWFSQMMKDEDFVERVISRYRELRRGVLSEAYLLEYIAQTEQWLGSAVERNFAVWGYSFDPSQLSSHERRKPDLASGQSLSDVNPASHEQAVQWMVDYLIRRGRFLDAHIESLRQYCHPSKDAVLTLG